MSRPKITISAPAPILPGSLATAYAQCGKKNCRCHSESDKPHGPYFRWTGLIDGRPTSVALTPAMFKKCKSRISNYKKLISKLDSAVAKALANAPWSEND